ncbi:hypothetical protein [Ekhidna lutea]|nr:hypothetical protein [Ekhidna lutea]
MNKVWKLIKRMFWVAIIGTMIAFHNTYTQEFKSLDDVRQEIIEEDEED